MTQIDGSMSDEDRLLEKLRKLELLFAGAYADGERAAAANAIDAIRTRLENTRRQRIAGTKFVIDSILRVDARIAVVTFSPCRRNTRNGSIAAGSGHRRSRGWR